MDRLQIEAYHLVGLGAPLTLSQCSIGQHGVNQTLFTWDRTAFDLSRRAELWAAAGEELEKWRAVQVIETDL